MLKVKAFQNIKEITLYFARFTIHVCILMWEQVFAHVLLQLAVSANKQAIQYVKVNEKVRRERPGSAWISLVVSVFHTQPGSTGSKCGFNSNGSHFFIR